VVHDEIPPKNKLAAFTRRLPRLTDDSIESSRSVESPSGRIYVVEVSRAKRPTAFVHGPWRFWSMVRRDRSWWVTLREVGMLPTPIIRERWQDPASASASADQLVEAVQRGESLGRPYLLRRTRS
jgi:hypothetical protein